MAKRIAVAGWATWLSVATTSLLVMPPFSRPAGAARLVSNFLPFGLMRSMAPLFKLFWIRAPQRRASPAIDM